MPRINGSVRVSNHHLCNLIVGSTTVEQPFTQNTGNLGVDFVYDGYALRLVARYKQAFGRDLGDFSAGVQVVHE